MENSFERRRILVYALVCALVGIIALGALFLVSPGGVHLPTADQEPTVTSTLAVDYGCDICDFDW